MKRIGVWIWVCFGGGGCPQDDAAGVGRGGGWRDRHVDCRRNERQCAGSVPQRFSLALHKGVRWHRDDETSVADVSQRVVSARGGDGRYGGVARTTVRARVTGFSHHCQKRWLRLECCVFETAP